MLGCTGLVLSLVASEMMDDDEDMDNMLMDGPDDFDMEKAAEDWVIRLGLLGGRRYRRPRPRRIRINLRRRRPFRMSRPGGLRIRLLKDEIEQHDDETSIEGDAQTVPPLNPPVCPKPCPAPVCPLPKCVACPCPTCGPCPTCQKCLIPFPFDSVDDKMTKDDWIDRMLDAEADDFDRGYD